MSDWQKVNEIIFRLLHPDTSTSHKAPAPPRRALAGDYFIYMSEQQLNLPNSETIKIAGLWFFKAWHYGKDPDGIYAMNRERIEQECMQQLILEKAERQYIQRLLKKRKIFNTPDFFVPVLSFLALEQDTETHVLTTDLLTSQAYKIFDGSIDQPLLEGATQKTLQKATSSIEPNTLSYYLQNFLSQDPKPVVFIRILAILREQLLLDFTEIFLHETVRNVVATLPNNILASKSIAPILKRCLHSLEELMQFRVRAFKQLQSTDVSINYKPYFEKAKKAVQLFFKSPSNLEFLRKVSTAELQLRCVLKILNTFIVSRHIFRHFFSETVLQVLLLGLATATSFKSSDHEACESAIKKIRSPSSYSDFIFDDYFMRSLLNLFAKRAATELAIALAMPACEVSRIRTAFDIQATKETRNQVIDPDASFKLKGFTGTIKVPWTAMHYIDLCVSEYKTSKNSVEGENYSKFLRDASDIIKDQEKSAWMTGLPYKNIVTVKALFYNYGLPRALTKEAALHLYNAIEKASELLKSNIEATQGNMSKIGIAEAVKDIMLVPNRFDPFGTSDNQATTQMGLLNSNESIAKCLDGLKEDLTVFLTNSSGP